MEFLPPDIVFLPYSKTYTSNFDVKFERFNSREGKDEAK
jgi:hypothetical protein